MHRMICLTVYGFVSFLASQCLSFAKEKEVKIHGYITELESSTDFRIDDYRITRDSSLALEFEKDQNDPKLPIIFLPADLRVGTEIEVKGLLDDSGGLKATSVKVHLTDQKTIRRTALLEQPPSLSKTDGTWSGELYADGQKIVVRSSTKLTFVPNAREKNAKKAASKAKVDSEGQEPADFDGVPLESASLITADTWVDFRGVRQPDGTILATSLQFKKNELERGEARLRKGLSPKVKTLKNEAAELMIVGAGKFRLFPDQKLQEYVSELGSRLVPEFQRSMPADNPDKINFRFFVVDSKITNAFSLSNGTVVIHSNLIRVLENEAQLASILGHEISHVVEEHIYRQMQYHKWSLLALEVGGAIAASRRNYSAADAAKLVEAAIRNGYARSLEDQADRLGLKYMIDAGYDPREAPRVWKVLSIAGVDGPTNFFWSTHNNNTVRRSYLMAELRNNYSGLDYSRLQRGEERFVNIVSVVNSRRVQGKRLRVH
jgi:hypothetical protein